MQEQSSDIPLQELNDQITQAAGVKLFLLRTDLNHEFISGNKLFKLKYNIEEAQKQNKDTLLTFGGAFSNHIAATAAAGKEYGFKTVGIIRGEESEILNPTLQFAIAQGMKLYYVSREKYKSKHMIEYSNLLDQQFSNFFLIPEGGANLLGIKGCKEIISHIHISFDFVISACGTGTTLTGIISSLKRNEKAIGFQVLKGENYMKNEVDHWLIQSGEKNKNNWEINEDYHFGGYAKRDTKLITFISKFEKEHAIPLDFIYTGKMMYGIYDLIKKGLFKKGTVIIAVHTGGLQGNTGFKTKW
jgi:1-aminocyclopropane-1-carboxylate deaminase